MKKKGFIITLSVVGAILLIVFIGFAVLFLSGNQLTVARCIVTENGSLYMIYDDRPIQLNYDGNTDYQTGNQLLIVHASAFAESYPEQARTVFVMKVGSGTKEDVPQEAVDILIETGNVIAGVMPKNTTLEFWITEDVEGVDWSGHDGISGWFGAREFLGKGYNKVVDQDGVGRRPKYYVSYVISAWPDYADGGAFVTDIWITDPAVLVYGLTVNSTFDDFDAVFEPLGYELSWGDGAIKTRVAEKNGIIYRLTGVVDDNPDIVPTLRITAEITNRDGIRF